MTSLELGPDGKPARTAIASDLRLAEHARALRHQALPGAGRAALPARLERLRTELLDQSDDIDALVWLGDERANECAIVVLELVLAVGSALRARSSDLNDAGNAGSTGKERLRALVGDLVNDSDDPPIWPRVELSLERPTNVLSALQGTRELSRLPQESTPSLSRQAPTSLTLLADMLRLPHDVDPIGWLARERTRACARGCLQYLLRQIVPPIRSWQDDPGAPLPVVSSCVNESAIQASVDGVSVRGDGFAVHVTVDFDRPAAAKADWLISWEGFERLVDNEGRHYIGMPVDQQVTRRTAPWGRRWRERLTIGCVPRLPRGTTLRLESETVLAAYEPLEISGELVPRPAPILGPMVCTIVQQS